MEILRVSNDELCQACYFVMLLHCLNDLRSRDTHCAG